MSEDTFHIQKTEDGEISASFKPAKIMPFEPTETGQNEEGAVMSPSESLANDTDDDNKDGNLTTDIGNSESGIDNRSPSPCDSSIGNENFGEPSAASTPLSQKVVSTVESETTPLLNSKSPTADSCIGLDMEETDDASEASCACSYHGGGDCPEHGSQNNVPTASPTERKPSLMVPGSIRVPIVGHETMEARSKFTVFKIHVMVEDDDTGWFIFRRYSDFVCLNDQLEILFPNFRLALPPKRWFRSNFDNEFLEERQLGLQAFVNNVTGHRDICSSKPVRDFFCFDDPPGPHDSVEESRAQCECMEEMIYLLRKELSEKDTEMELLREELELYKSQVQLLTNRLSELNKLSSLEKSGRRATITSAAGQYDIDALFGEGDKLLSNKVNWTATTNSVWGTDEMGEADLMMQARAFNVPGVQNHCPPCVVGASGRTAATWVTALSVVLTMSFTPRYADGCKSGLLDCRFPPLPTCCVNQERHCASKPFLYQVQDPPWYSCPPKCPKFKKPLIRRKEYDYQLTYDYQLEYIKPHLEDRIMPCMAFWFYCDHIPPHKYGEWDKIVNRESAWPIDPWPPMPQDVCPPPRECVPCGPGPWSNPELRRFFYYDCQ